ncbi:adherence factor [Chlamydia felis Fe/C-56]|uniref:Adherence factor n=1 Tax=Chlamydia felis (strain Fe/C-56) TaxID=264202 RepID=Q254S4_CHLFF|nr:LifA/Efa1-related large cytotoxin [Chlamydia felis]BAE81214.1 adherence factor [Chlamydia felis Fe/C-56]
MTLPENVTSASLQFNYTSQSTANSSYLNQSSLASTSLDDRLALYDEAVNQNNSTEGVVKIGEMIQKDLYNLTQSNTTEFAASPANHTGNWKTSLLYNLAQLVANLFQVQVIPAKIIKSTTPPPPTPEEPKKTPTKTPAQHTNKHMRTSSSQQRPRLGGGVPGVSPSTKSRTVSSRNLRAEKLRSFSRKRRSLEEKAEGKVSSSYDLTSNNILEKLKLTEEQRQKCQRAINSLKKSINLYNLLEDKNSREGQNLLAKQANALSSIQKTAQLTQDHESTKVLSSIKAEYSSHRVLVDKHFHGIWIAGSPPDGVDTYIKLFLEVHPDFDFLFWVDEKAYGAAKFTSTMKKIAFDAALVELRNKIPAADQEFIKKYDDLKQKHAETKNPREKKAYNRELLDLYTSYSRINKDIKEKFDVLFLKNMVTYQDSFFNWCLLKGVDRISDENRIEYLEKELKLSEDEVKQYKETIETNKKKIQDIVAKVNEGLGSEKVHIKDIKELKSMQDRTNRFNYDLEMFLRWNYPAASDQIRMYMLKEYGGIYTDLDMMPPYSQEIVKLIQEKGGSRFLDETPNRRAVSAAVLRMASGQEVTIDKIGEDIDISKLTAEDKTKLNNLISSFQSMSTGSNTDSRKRHVHHFFQKFNLEVIRDHMPILRRYHKRANGEWNVRGLNGFMLAHQGSEVVDRVIQGQQQAYNEVRNLRETVLSGEFFNTLDDLKQFHHKAVVGGHLVENYLAGSLFHDFRQDTVIPHALSTLGISGPDLITKQMVQYFQDLGTLGQDYLRMKGKKLNTAAYIGTYKEIRDENGKIVTLDWSNPISVGANDVTPADESTWCVSKQKCAAELLFSDTSKLRTESPKKIERTRVSTDEFTKLWSEDSKKHLPNDLLDRFNLLIESSNVDIVQISEWDRDAYILKTKISNDAAATASIFSLQLQIAYLIRSTHLPISNQVNFFLDTYKNFESNIEKSIQLYLNSHPQTKIIFWHSETSDLSLFLKDIMSVSARKQAIHKLVSSTEQPAMSTEVAALLEQYSELKSKDSLDILTPEESDKFLELTLQLSENKDITTKIKTLEAEITSGHFFKDLENTMKSWLKLSEDKRKKKVLERIKKMEKDGEKGKQDQKNKKQWYDELYDKAYKKRVIDPKNKLQKVFQKFQDTNRVKIEDLDKLLHDKPLFAQMYKDGYSFNDLKDIYKFMAADRGISGIFSSDSIFPKPSNQLVDIIKTSLGEDYDEAARALPIIYDYLAMDPKSSEAQQALENIPDDLREKLKTSLPSDLLVPAVDASVSALGMQYGTENGLESEHVMTSVIPGILNPSSYTMAHYLEALYVLHKEIHNGSLTAEKAKQLLKDEGAYCFTHETGINDLIERAKSKDYLSLTEIHRILTNQKNLAQATSSLLSRILPGANGILQREADFGRPLATVMADSPAINSYDYLGVGLSKDLFSTPPDIPTIQSVVEQAKYTVFSWKEFYESHVALWDVVAARLGSEKTQIHPQTFLYELEGRCMGLSMLYMSATDVVTYATLVENLMTAGALFQTKEIERLPLTWSDDRFLSKTLNLVDWLQYQGNKNLKASGILTPHNWDIPTLSKFFETHPNVKSLLVTTPSHSMVLQPLGSTYRVTDPNFGHVDFPSMEAALYFLELSVQLSDKIKARYGISDDQPIQQQIKVFSADTQQAQHTWFPSTEAGLISQHHYPTWEKMILKSELTINHIRTTWDKLYSIGGSINNKRIDETTREADLDRLKLNGDILSEFLSKNVLDAESVKLISHLLETRGVEPGTKQVSRGAIVETPNDFAPLLLSIKARASRARSMLQNIMGEISKKIQELNPSKDKKISVQNIEVTDGDEISFDFKLGESLLKKLKIKSHGLVSTFKKFGSMLNDLASTGVMDLELGMSIVSIVQYVRLVQAGKSGDPLATFDLLLEVKELSEMTLGAIIQGVAGKFITSEGIDGFRLESVLSKQLIKASHRVGGTAGKALARAAQVLELPILEAVAGVWGLYNSVDELLHASSHSDLMSARVQVAFDVITLALTGASIVAPAAMLAVGPIAAIGMGAASIARNVAKTEERHWKWEQYKQFLQEGGEKVLTAIPERGLLDFSGNLVLGNIKLDLGKNPPTLTGERSYNFNQWLGHKPTWSDWQVRDRLGYGYRISPERALAKGHANSWWPLHVPTVPRGTYNTVILGYGITYKAVTEVVYLSNRVVWREAVLEPESRRYEPPLSAQNKLSTVIAGTTPLTVIPVRLLDEDSDERIATASMYKDYKITVVGGMGGLTVQIGGAGYYNITGDPRTENTISFRAIPQPFSVNFNLTKLEQEVPLIRSNGTKLNILKIRQKGFTTIIGSSSGQDTLAGNHNTKFYLSPGGGTIYSGTGKNQYHIPKLNGNLTIVLATNSTEHNLYLNMNSFEMKSCGDNLNLVGLNGNSTGIYIQNADNSTSYNHWTDCFRVKFTDGITVQAIEKATPENTTSTVTLGFKTCDQHAWALKHPEEPGFPENIIQYMKKNLWWFAPKVSIIQRESEVSYFDYEKLLVYKPASYTELVIRAQDTYQTKVEGAVGVSYILSSSPNTNTSRITIQLADDGDSPQLLDMSNIVPSLVLGKITNGTANTSSIDLEVSSPRYKIPLTLQWNPEEPPWQTVVEINPHDCPTLGQWYRTLQENPTKWHTLYHHSALIPERFEGIMSLNNTAVLMLSESRKNREHILGVENRGEVNLKIWGTLWSGYIKGALPHHLRWIMFKNFRNLKKFDITIRPHHFQYLAFEGSDRSGDNILFHSVLESYPFEAKVKPQTQLSRHHWKYYDEIRVFATSLNLQDFNRYRIASENEALSRQLMYAQGLVSISNRDFILKFFYIREGVGIGAIRLVFKNFFVPSMDEIHESTLEKEAKPILAANPRQLIDSAYWNYLELTLGEEKFNLATLAKEFSSSSHILPLKEDKTHHLLALPEKYRAENLVVLTYTINPKNNNTSIKNTLKIIDKEMQEYKLPLPTIVESSYYLDPVTGDLYLTRILENTTKNQAFVIKLKGFKRDWDAFKNTLISGEHTKLITSSGTMVTFVGPELRHLEIDFPKNITETTFLKESVISRSGLVFPPNDQVVHYDPRVNAQFYTWFDYVLWNLRDRAKGSKRAKAYDNYLLESAMHIYDKNPEWKVPESMLEYAAGYYRAQTSHWVRYHMRVGTRMKVPAGSIKISLITTQNEIFSRKSGSGYNIYFIILGLNKHVITHTQPGNMLVDVNKDTVLTVKKIDESEYHKKRIYVVTEMTSEETRKLQADKNVIVIPGGEIGNNKRKNSDREVISTTVLLKNQHHYGKDV